LKKRRSNWVLLDEIGLLRADPINMLSSTAAGLGLTREGVVD